MSYFEKVAHMSVVWVYVSLWLCGFVCLDVNVAIANKVEGTMSWCLGTNENSSGQGIKLEEASWQNNDILFYWVE